MNPSSWMQVWKGLCGIQASTASRQHRIPWKMTKLELIEQGFSNSPNFCGSKPRHTYSLTVHILHLSVAAFVIKPKEPLWDLHQKLWGTQLAAPCSLLPSGEDPCPTPRVCIRKARVIAVWVYPQPSFPTDQATFEVFLFLTIGTYKMCGMQRGKCMINIKILKDNHHWSLLHVLSVLSIEKYRRIKRYMCILYREGGRFRLESYCAFYFMPWFIVT